MQSVLDLFWGQPTLKKNKGAIKVKYDTDELQQMGTKIFLSGQYINEAICDILSMNSFIKKAKCKNLI